ncbi:homoserine kinase [Candidatus Woesearchaeota archaeon]|nr:homoserine kinase [Candidatus Woesearchaeota archaeon]
MTIITLLGAKDFRDILSGYDAGSYRSHKHIPWALQNTVYLLKTTRGRYVLKILEESDVDFFKYQLRIIDYASRKKLPVARMIKSLDGKELIIHEGKRMCLQKFIDGTEPRKYTPALIADIATKSGRLSKALMRLKLNRRYIWIKDHQFKPKGPRRSIVEGINILKEEQELLKELKAIDRGKLRRSVIHGDLHGVNLLVKDDKLLAIIDWDDCHEDYLAQELAVILLDPCVRRAGVRKDRLKLMLREYQKHVKLNHEEKKATYYFIRKRVITTIYWLQRQMKAHPDMKRSLERMLKKKLKIYEKIKAFRLEEFLELAR